MSDFVRVVEVGPVMGSKTKPWPLQRISKLISLIV